MSSGGGRGILSVNTVWTSSLWTLWFMWFLKPGATGGSVSPEASSRDAIV